MAEVPLPTPTQVPVPSTDIRNAVFAGAKLDEEVTGTGEFYTDRLGVKRLTNTGRNNQFDAAQLDRANRFEQFLLSSGYVFLGDYEDGPFQFSARNQYVRYDNQYYRLNAATDVGFTTTGTDAISFANDVAHFVLMDGDTLRQNLGSSEHGFGISLTALEQGGNGQDLAVFVSPQMRHSDPHSFFGAATMNAFMTAMDMGIGEVRIPAGEYILESTVSVTLTMHMSLTFDPGVIIYVDSPKDVFNININGFNLDIRASNGRIMSRWGSADGSSVAAFRITDASLDKSVSTDSLKVGSADGTSRFGYAVWGSGINLATFYRCLLQGIRGIYLESPLISGTTAHAMGAQIFGCEIYTTNECVKIANQGALGAEGIGVWGCEFVTGGIAI
ncbi:hypothetical protein JQ502_05810, partial [Klebsiella pneumoniae]|nr:hypothetical protein [Klebsiella pneumoniae]